MKRILRIVIFVPLLLCLACSVCHAQPRMSRKARAEYDRVVAQNDSLRRRIDSLELEIRGHLLRIDSLCTPAGEAFCDSTGFNPSDSLLQVFYVMQGSAFSQNFDMEKERFSSDVPDEVFMLRLKDMNSFIPLPFNTVVKNCCILYSEKMKERMGSIIGDCEYYWPLFDEILSHYGVPLELKALVIVESMMRPTATSRVGAKGLWQFMYGTAKGYGMRIDSFTDERMDPVKSTVCAARYLKDAYGIFGDWTLAIASYNCGAGNVNKAIRRSGGKRDFWQIYDYLPRETRGYVPAFVGVLYAVHYYNEHGIVPRPSALAVPVDTVEIRKNLHFDQIEGVTGLPAATVEALNPQYMHKIVPGDKYSCVLRVPLEYANAFIDAGESLYEYRKNELLDPLQIKKIEDGAVGQGNRIVYKVKSGDVLGRIAARYGVTVAQIKKWNGLSSTNIRIGQKLVIYTRKP